MAEAATPTEIQPRLHEGEKAASRQWQRARRSSATEPTAPNLNLSVCQVGPGEPLTKQPATRGGLKRASAVQTDASGGQWGTDPYPCGSPPRRHPWTGEGLARATERRRGCAWGPGGRPERDRWKRPYYSSRSKRSAGERSQGPPPDGQDGTITHSQRDRPRRSKSWPNSFDGARCPRGWPRRWASRRAAGATGGRFWPRPAGGYARASLD